MYQPCRWQRSSLTCETNGQQLACDCELYPASCPERHAPQAATAHATADAGAEGMSSFETFVMVIAILIIVGGCGGVVWFAMRMASSNLGPAQLDDDAIVGDDGPVKSSRKKKVRTAGPLISVVPRPADTLRLLWRTAELLPC